MVRLQPPLCRPRTGIHTMTLDPLIFAHTNVMHHVEIVSRLEGEHIDHLEELIADATLVDHHEPLGEHKFLRLRHGDDLGVAMLAYEGDNLVGYAHTLAYGPAGDRRVSCEVVVHPEHRRLGIGTALVERVIEHARSQDAARLDLWAYNDSEASRRFAQTFALDETRRLLHMHRHPGEPPHLPVRRGARVRPFRTSAEDETIVELNDHIFAAHPEQGKWTLEDFRVRKQRPWFNPQDLLILEVEGDLAGFCWMKVEERGTEGRVGEIYVIGTAPEYQGRGLGRFLLSEALQHLSTRDVNAVAVYVDESNTAAVRLYEAFEFHHHHVDVCYTLPLKEAAAITGQTRADERPGVASTG